jgi:hypothetical protein
MGNPRSSNASMTSRRLLNPATLHHPECRTRHLHVCWTCDLLSYGQCPQVGPEKSM